MRESTYGEMLLTQLKSFQPELNVPIGHGVKT